MRTNRLKGVAAGLGGVGLVALITLILVLRRSPEDELIRKVAGSFGVSSAEYKHETAIVDAVQKSRDVDQGEWTEIRAWYGSPNQFTRQEALMAMAFLGKTSSHRDEAIQLAKSYLGEGKTDGSITATLVLRRLGDRSWKQYATALSHNQNSSVSEVATTMLSQDKTREKS